ncbi:hypothetical protein [Solimonas fluminis]|nr:hypothetical protein [Solimonas fluminis]
MKHALLAVVIGLASTAAFAHSETKTFTYSGDNDVRACAGAKSSAQQWASTQVGFPQYYPYAWKPTSVQYSNCSCAQTGSGSDCSVDATLSN